MHWEHTATAAAAMTTLLAGALLVGGPSAGIAQRPEPEHAPGATPSVTPTPEPGETPARDPIRFRIVSAPDTWNTDLGDITDASGWDPGEPNSINRPWRRETDAVLDDMARRKPRFVLVAGDLVQGRWDEDADGYGTFGSIATLAGRERAVRRAARTYYGHWRAQFARHDLATYPALGDHELGDNWWDTADARALAPAFRDAWARAFTLRRRRPRFIHAMHPPARTQHAATAYAFRSGPVLVVTIDPFHARADGTIHAEVVRSQLRWLDRVLRRAAADASVRFVVVQGHVPVLTTSRSTFSSELRLNDGASSPFWRTLEKHGVDVYLAGEMHAVSTAHHGGVEQIVHGASLRYWRFNYLTIAVSASELRLSLRVAPISRRTEHRRLWQSTGHRPPASLRVGRFRVAGSMRIAADGGASDRRGLLRLRP